MDRFFRVQTVDEVIARIDGFSPTPPETVDLAEAWGRVLAEPLAAREDVPLFARSGMDGFAVQARDTFGASETMPALLTVIGEVAMGLEPSFSLSTGETARIATGGMLPTGADAVVMGRVFPHGGRPGRGTGPARGPPMTM